MSNENIFNEKILTKLLRLYEKTLKVKSNTKISLSLTELTIKELKIWIKEIKELLNIDCKVTVYLSETFLTDEGVKERFLEALKHFEIKGIEIESYDED